MDIYLLREGKEIGPLSEETTHSFLELGSIAMDDLAWTPGLPAWSPLLQVLHPVKAPIEPPPIAAPVPARITPGDPATAKQKAFLSYMSIAFPSDMTKEQAALLANEAMENPKLNARVLQWNDDRLRLHPDIFAAEAQAKKDDRANHFFEACQHEGSERVMDVTKAHCQVLVGYLDVNYPNWDANESAAAWDYFFPAVAEKFPHLVRKPWRGKLKYADGPKVAVEIVQRGPAVQSHGRPSPIGALIRGAVFGLALLLLVYVGVQMVTGDSAEPAAVVTAGKPASVIAADSPGIAESPVREIVKAPAPKPAPEPPEMESPAAPAEPSAADPMADDPAPPAAAALKTSVIMVKPVDVKLRFGSAKLPVGAQLKIVSQNGSQVTVTYGAETVTIPIEATDLAAPLPVQ